MKQILYKRTRETIRIWGELFIDEIKSGLRIDKTWASGDTANSLEGRFSANENEIRYDILAREKKGHNILDIIDKGRRPGRRPHQSVILKWMKDKGVQPRQKSGKYKTSSEKNMRDAAFMIARAIGRSGTIKRFGYRGSDVIGFVVKTKGDKMTEDVAASFELDLADYLEGKLKKPRIGRR